MEEVITNEENKYNLRPLKDRDLWPVLDILGKVFPDEVGKIFAEVAVGDKTIEQVGASVTMKLVTAVLKNIGKVHDEVYSLLSDLSGKPAEEIEDMPFGTTPGMIWEIVKEAKNGPFFRELAKLSSTEK